MSENLGHFLVDLACDPHKMAEFLGDPAKVLDAAELSELERNAVLARDPRLVADALGTTAYSLGQGVEDIPPAPSPRRKRKTPSRKRPSRKAPPKKRGPAKPTRKAPARKKR